MCHLVACIGYKRKVLKRHMIMSAFFVRNCKMCSRVSCSVSDTKSNLKFNKVPEPLISAIFFIWKIQNVSGLGQMVLRSYTSEHKGL